MSARATLYVAAYDEATRAIGLAYSSSGANFWQTRIKGKGMVAAQASGLCAEATPAAFLQQGLSAAAITAEIEKQCTAVDWHRYRLAAITVDAAIAGFIAAEGCTSTNQECGKLTDKHFLVMGGGLEAEVLEAARTHYFQLPAELSFACRLYSTLEAIYAAGGEKKEFKGASIAIDAPDSSRLLAWEARGPEANLLSSLQKQMSAEGVTCPAR